MGVGVELGNDLIDAGHIQRRHEHRGHPQIRGGVDTGYRDEIESGVVQQLQLAGEGGPHDRIDPPHSLVGLSHSTPISSTCKDTTSISPGRPRYPRTRSRRISNPCLSGATMATPTV